MNNSIKGIILEHFSDVQAISLFGSIGTADEWPDSDIDIAILLPPADAKRKGFLNLGDARFELERG